MLVHQVAQLVHCYFSPCLFQTSLEPAHASSQLSLMEAFLHSRQLFNGIPVEEAARTLVVIPKPRAVVCNNFWLQFASLTGASPCAKAAVTLNRRDVFLWRRPPSRYAQSLPWMNLRGLMTRSDQFTDWTAPLYIHTLQWVVFWKRFYYIEWNRYT